VLGGSTENGNVTPFAEKNIHHDPCAADIVFKSCIPILMCGLNVTARFAAEYPNLLETIPVAAVLSDNFYTAVSCFVAIERNSPRTEGMTVCDLYGKNGNSPNASVMTALDIAELLRIVNET
jgi:purine nucleosidase/pyrimidine-specific ribonucleoside hydrolase